MMREVIKQKLNLFVDFFPIRFPFYISGICCLCIAHRAVRRVVLARGIFGGMGFCAYFYTVKACVCVCVCVLVSQ